MTAEFYITADLHYGHTTRGDRSTEALAQHVIDHPADALVLVGDIGRDPKTLSACLQLFAQFTGQKLAVPGNHDVWMTGWDAFNPQDSWDLHEIHIPKILRDNGFHPLHREPLFLDQLCFVGSMGWYDYSFRDDIGIALEHYQTKTPPGAAGPLWNDARFANFPINDVELTHRLNSRLAAHLAQNKNGVPTVAAVHHVVTKRLLVHPRNIVPMRWRFANTFLGAECFGDTLVANPNVQSVFCGHIHMARQIEVRGYPWTTVGSDYRAKQLLRATSDRILDTRMFNTSA